jgi:hypothetical protein
LTTKIPESTNACPVSGVTSRKLLTYSIEQNSVIRSTPARYYQLQSNRTISSARGQMAYVALDIHLRLLPLGWRGQRDHPEDVGTDALSDGLDDPALADPVTAF